LTIKLSPETAQHLINYVSKLQEAISPEVITPTREQADALAYLVVELADA
jgi:hypothetical protein